MREFTATIYIFREMKVLLHFHQKHQKWLPPGGHVEENELPSEAAIREAKEEAGIDAQILSDEHLSIQAYHAYSMPRPYLCLIEKIPMRNNHEAHEHIDFIYIGKIKEESTPHKDFRWFTLDEMKELLSQDLVFSDAVEVVKSYLTTTYGHGAALSSPVAADD